MWIPRRVWDQNAAEKDRLMSLVESLADQVVRLERRREGLPERPVEKAGPLVIPATVEEAIRAWSTPHVQRLQRARALQLYAETQDWSVVLERMNEPQEAEV